MPEASFVERVAAASLGNFLYLVWLLPAIAAGTQHFDALDALPQGLDGIYREFLRTRKTADEALWRRVYEPILGVLAAAQAPLTPRRSGTVHRHSTARYALACTI